MAACTATICRYLPLLIGRTAYILPVLPPLRSGGIAITVPQWDGTKCAQCNLCAMVCPHAVIRPIAMNAEEAAAAPEVCPW